MGKKYRVRQGEQYYGNYHAKTPNEAIWKAIHKNSKYYKFDMATPFQIKYGQEEVEVFCEG